VSDLSVHCSNRHFVEYNSLPKSFLTARTCFYFIIHPQDYAKIHQPEKWNSPNAYEARRLILRMLESRSDSQVKRDNWRRGWRVAIKQNTEDKETEVQRKMCNQCIKKLTNVIRKETKEQKSNQEKLKETNVEQEQNVPLDLSNKSEVNQKNKEKRKAEALCEKEVVKVKKVSP
jgi:hypothetical protein